MPDYQCITEVAVASSRKRLRGYVLTRFRQGKSPYNPPCHSCKCLTKNYLHSLQTSSSPQQRH